MNHELIDRPPELTEAVLKEDIVFMAHNFIPHHLWDPITPSADSIWKHDVDSGQYAFRVYLKHGQQLLVVNIFNHEDQRVIPLIRYYVSRLMDLKPILPKARPLVFPRLTDHGSFGMAVWKVGDKLMAPKLYFPPHFPEMEARAFFKITEVEILHQAYLRAKENAE